MKYFGLCLMLLAGCSSPSTPDTTKSDMMMPVMPATTSMDVHDGGVDSSTSMTVHDVDAATAVDSGAIMCSDPQGLFHIEYTTTSGNCGNFMAKDVVLPSRNSNNCVASASSMSSDNCSGSLSDTCTGSYQYACNSAPNGEVPASPVGWAPCATGLVLCTSLGSASCNNPMTDAFACGGCGNQCPSHAACINAKCQCVGTSVENDIITIDSNVDGSKLTGTIGARLYNPDGTGCVGTYSFTETKLHN